MQAALCPNEPTYTHNKKLSEFQKLLEVDKAIAIDIRRKTSVQFREEDHQVVMSDDESQDNSPPMPKSRQIAHRRLESDDFSSCKSIEERNIYNHK